MKVSRIYDLNRTAGGNHDETNGQSTRVSKLEVFIQKWVSRFIHKTYVMQLC